MKQAILILHGWGLQGSRYEKLASLFDSKKYNVYTLDFPGFASEPLKKSNMNLNDYVYFVHDFITRNRIPKPILIGHSFGGRVAVKYAWRYPKEVSKLVLTGVPIIRHMPISKKIATFVAHSGTKLLSFLPFNAKDLLRKILYKSIGEWDYYKAGEKRQVFKNIINEDLVSYVKQIQIPTLLLWGEKDSIVPLADVAIIKNLIPKAKVSVIPGETHKLPYDNPKAFIEAMQQFI